MTETLNQYANRIVAHARKRLLDRLDDDVIGRLDESHIVFARACVVEAVNTAMSESRPTFTPAPDVETLARELLAAEYEREETTLDEVVRRIRDGIFYDDYDWASGPALRALDKAVAALRSANAQSSLPDDLRRLVIAAREVAYEDPDPEKLHELDKAVEAFGDRVRWDEEPAIEAMGGTVVDDAQGGVDREARFLCERLREFDPDDDDAVSQFHGHIVPSLARLEALLAGGMER